MAEDPQFAHEFRDRASAFRGSQRPDDGRPLRRFDDPHGETFHLLRRVGLRPFAQTRPARLFGAQRQRHMFAARGRRHGGTCGGADHEHALAAGSGRMGHVEAGQHGAAQERRRRRKTQIYRGRLRAAFQPGGRRKNNAGEDRLPFVPGPHPLVHPGPRSLHRPRRPSDVSAKLGDVLVGGPTLPFVQAQLKVAAYRFDGTCSRRFALVVFICPRSCFRYSLLFSSEEK